MQMRFARPNRPTPVTGRSTGSTARSEQVVDRRRVAAVGEPSGGRIYNALLADKDTGPGQPNYGGGDRFDPGQRGFGALKSLKPSTLPAAVGSLLAPREVTPTNKSALDLVVILESRDLSKATLNSVFATAIRSTEKAPEIRREAIAKLAELAKKYPTDFSVHTAAALAAFADGKPDGIREAVDRLVKLVETAPLEPLPANGKANARQRADALPQVPLWLVARECLGKDKDREAFRAAGEKLAARAVAAAKRQQDPLFAAAILREWGQLDLDRGDKSKAEARWTELLELMMPKPSLTKAVGAVPTPGAHCRRLQLYPPPEEQSRGTAEAGTVFVSAALPQVPPAVAAPTPTGKSPAPPSRGNAPVLTVDQFQQAYAVATLAAEKDLPGLSLKAIKDAVRGGPPVPGKVNRNHGGRLTSRMIGGVQYYVEDMGDNQISVDRALTELVPKWRAMKVPAADIYDVLVGVVLPDARPAEVFLYAEGRVYGTVYSISPADI